MTEELHQAKSAHSIDFKPTPKPITPTASNSVWQKAVASLVVLIIAVSAIVVLALSQRLVNAQDKFATQQTAIVNQLITKIDDLQALNEKQLKTLKESQAKELKIFKTLQEQKLQELQDAQTALLESFKDNRNEQLKLLREQMKHLPGAPKQDD
jgi:selenocysteine-specific translation elongation factor